MSLRIAAIRISCRFLGFSSPQIDWEINPQEGPVSFVVESQCLREVTISNNSSCLSIVGDSINVYDPDLTSDAFLLRVPLLSYKQNSDPSFLFSDDLIFLSLRIHIASIRVVFPELL